MQRVLYLSMVLVAGAVMPFAMAGDAQQDGVKLEAPSRRPDLGALHQRRTPSYHPIKEYGNRDAPAQRAHDERRRKQLDALGTEETINGNSQTKVKDFTIKRRERLNEELNDDSLIDVEPAEQGWWDRWRARRNAR
jgi:hypothetical protein